MVQNVKNDACDRNHTRDVLAVHLILYDLTVLEWFYNICVTIILKETVLDGFKM